MVVGGKMRKDMEADETVCIIMQHQTCPVQGSSLRYGGASDRPWWNVTRCAGAAPDDESPRQSSMTPANSVDRAGRLCGVMPCFQFGI